MKNKLIKFILSFTDYDKLKKENKELKSDIYILVEKQGELECYHVMTKYKLSHMMDKVIWFGSGDVNVNQGIFDGITQDKTI